MAFQTSAFQVDAFQQTNPAPPAPSARPEGGGLPRRVKRRWADVWIIKDSDEEHEAESLAEAQEIAQTLTKPVIVIGQGVRVEAKGQGISLPATLPATNRTFTRLAKIERAIPWEDMQAAAAWRKRLDEDDEDIQWLM
jgi:hypothetical protein